MTKCKGITLGQLLDVCGVGTILHIAADYSDGWAFTGTAEQALQEMNGWKDREIIHMYMHEGRDACPTCCKMEPGLAVVVEGYNDTGKAV
ncbi:MAG: hypothetical protein ACI4PO_09260 [Faecousia sp.]